MIKLPSILLCATAIFMVTLLSVQSQEYSSKRWGMLSDGRTARLFSLRSQGGMTVKLSDYGALIVSIEAPDRNRKKENITLSYASLAEAEKGGVYGSTIGRFANRIDDGGFSIDGTRYDLESVNKKTKVHIHGGKEGFHRQLWDAATGTNAHGIFVRFTHQSPDGHEGYPGNVKVSVTYTLTRDNILRIHYEASTDKPTHINLTNHAYFNLAGKGDILKQELRLKNITQYLETDKRRVPTGEMLPVAGTPFDFTKEKPIGQAIGEIPGGGYDHCFVIDGSESNSDKIPIPFAKLRDPGSGRTLIISTTMPGVQIYTANHQKGNPFPKWGGICFETEYFPDTPNKPGFPTSVLRPGEKYEHVTDFQFGIEKEP